MLRVGIIGTGLVAREHARSIGMTGGRLSLVAAADTAADRLTGFCDDFDIARRYAGADALIADPEVDLVVITTPPAAHEAPAVAALDAGKYVLCEKPLAHTLASAQKIAEAEARNPGKLSVGYQFRYEPQFRRMKWLVDNGWLGEVRSALIARHSYIPHSDPGTGWWGVWSVAGGGVLITQLIHELDMLQLVMGKATSVSAEMDTRFSGIESEDFLQATIRFEGGRAARCVASVNSGYLGGGVEFQGTLGSIGQPEGLLLDDPVSQAKAMRAAEKAVPDEGASSLKSTIKRALGRAAPESRPHASLYLDIADAVDGGRPLPIPSSEALGSLELCMAIYESAIRGEEIQLPLGPQSTVYGGVAKADYDARRCVRSRTAPAVFRRSERRRPLTLRNVVVGTAKAGLSLAGVDTATVRALIRKPGEVHGGPKVRRLPWPVRRHYDHRERDAALRLLNREVKTGGAIYYGGPEEDAYCAAFARYLGGGYADAVNSGSNAIYVALRALDLEPGNEVIVPPITDPGATMPVVLNLCIPVPADAEPGSIMTSAEQIRKVMTDRTAAIIVAHMGGHAVDMDPVLALAAERGIPVLEDCAQAHGTLYKGRMAGSMGTISAFSTMFGKQHATGGQGGVVFTQDPILYARARQLGDRGKSPGPTGAMSNVVASLNFNQDELSMAIGRVQLAKLPATIKGRRAFAAQVIAGLQDAEGLEIIGEPEHCASSFWYLMIRFDPAIVRCTAQDFASGLVKEGIEGVAAGYSVYPTDQAWHRQAAVFGNSGLPWSLNQETPKAYPLPNAHEINARMVRIEIHESLGAQEARDIVAAARKVARFYSA